MNKQEHVLMKIIQKIRVFDGLEIHEAQTLLSYGHMRQFDIRGCRLQIRRPKRFVSCRNRCALWQTCRKLSPGFFFDLTIMGELNGCSFHPLYRGDT